MSGREEDFPPPASSHEERGEGEGSSSCDGIISVPRGIVERGGEKEEKERLRREREGEGEGRRRRGEFLEREEERGREGKRSEEEERIRKIEWEKKGEIA